MTVLSDVLSALQLNLLLGMDVRVTAVEVYMRSGRKKNKRARPENVHSPSGWQR